MALDLKKPAPLPPEGGHRVLFRAVKFDIHRRQFLVPDLQTTSQSAVPHCFSFYLSLVIPSERPGHELVRPTVPMASGGPLNEEQRAHFFEHAFVAVRGLVPKELLSRINRAQVEDSEETEIYNPLTHGLLHKCDVFAELALRSPVPQAVAQLTPRSDDRKLIALSDAAFVLRGSMSGCDFHADSLWFWPSPEDALGPGVNAWIALDRVDDDGGGLAVARGSHTTSYLDCRAALASAREDFCRLHKVAPELKRRFEEMAEVPRLEPGDVILHTRYCFHRAEPFKKGSAAEHGAGVARYSERYMPGNATALPVFGVAGSGPVVLSSADRDKYPLCEYEPYMHETSLQEHLIKEVV